MNIGDAIVCILFLVALVWGFAYSFDDGNEME